MKLSEPVRFNDEDRKHLEHFCKLPISLIEDLEATIKFGSPSAADSHELLTAKRANQQVKQLQADLKKCITGLEKIHPEISYKLHITPPFQFEIENVCEKLRRIEKGLSRIPARLGTPGPRSIDALEPAVCLTARILLQHGQTVEKTSELFVSVIEIVFRHLGVDNVDAQRAIERFWPQILIVKEFIDQRDDQE